MHCANRRRCVVLLCRKFCLRSLNAVRSMCRNAQFHCHTNINTGTVVNRNEVLSVLSIHATSFGCADRPYAIRCVALNCIICAFCFQICNVPPNVWAVYIYIYIYINFVDQIICCTACPRSTQSKHVACVDKNNKHLWLTAVCVSMSMCCARTVRFAQKVTPVNKTVFDISSQQQNAVTQC